MALYGDRTHAGKVLAFALREYATQADVVVLGLPRGGVVVAAEVARELHAPLDVVIVRKLGLPGHRELAMGALASGGVCLVDELLVRGTKVSDSELSEVISAERQELSRRERIYRGFRSAVSLHDKLCILVDDGLASGATMHAAVLGVRQQDPSEIVVAVPVGTKSAVQTLAREVDRVICAALPEPLEAVSHWYTNYTQTTDAEVQRLLEAAPRYDAGSPLDERVRARVRLRGGAPGQGAGR